MGRYAGFLTWQIMPYEGSAAILNDDEHVTLPPRQDDLTPRLSGFFTPCEGEGR